LSRGERVKSAGRERRQIILSFGSLHDFGTADAQVTTQQAALHRRCSNAVQGHRFITGIEARGSIVQLFQGNQVDAFPPQARLSDDPGRAGFILLESEAGNVTTKGFTRRRFEYQSLVFIASDCFLRNLFQAVARSSSIARDGGL